MSVNADLPAGVRGLLNKCSPGWSYRVTYATGLCEFGGLSTETDGEGKRKRVTVVEDVDSIGVRLCHAATGRGAVALWVRRPGYVGDGKLGVRWRQARRVGGRMLPPLLVLADPDAVALVSVLLRWRRRPYEPDMAWRGRHEGEHAPRQLSITELGAYVAQELPTALLPDAA